MVGLAFQKANYPASPPEIYAQLREQATLQCQPKKNMCNPSDSGSEHTFAHTDNLHAQLTLQFYSAVKIVLTVRHM